MNTWREIPQIPQGEYFKNAKKFQVISNYRFQLEGYPAPFGWSALIQLLTARNTR